MIAALGDTAKSKREPALSRRRHGRRARPTRTRACPRPHQQAATIGISGNAPRHAAQSALAQSEAHTPADWRPSIQLTRYLSGAEQGDRRGSRRALIPMSGCLRK